MNKLKKIICTVMCMSVMVTTGLACSTITSYAAVGEYTFVKTLTVGNGKDFDEKYYFNSNKGVLRCHFNQYLIDEAGVQVLHTTREHYGTVVFRKRTNSTNIAAAGVWTKRYDVRVDDKDTATYTALY